MRLTRKRAGRNVWNATPYGLVNSELPDPSRHQYKVLYSSSDPFSLEIEGFDGRDNADSRYWYEMTFTQREMQILLSRYLDMDNVPGNERRMWRVLLDLWEKRLKRRDRKKRISN